VLRKGEFPLPKIPILKNLSISSKYNHTRGCLPVYLNELFEASLRVIDESDSNPGVVGAQTTPRCQLGEIHHWNQRSTPRMIHPSSLLMLEKSLDLSPCVWNWHIPASLQC
jgi:hypothetical protein